MNLRILQWRSLKTKVTVFTLVIFVLSIWSLMLYVSHTLRQDMQRSIGDQQFSTASIVAAQINDELVNRFGALEEELFELQGIFVNIR